MLLFVVSQRALTANLILKSCRPSNAAGVIGGETIANILESMDIKGLSDKYCVALKQSLFLSFLYLIMASVVVIGILVAVYSKVSAKKGEWAVLGFSGWQR